jgi:hypothetical protein
MQSVTKHVVTRDTFDVISFRDLADTCGWMPLYEFEDLFCDLTQGQLIRAKRRPSLPRGLRKLRRHLYSDYRIDCPPPSGATGGRTLFVSALLPGDLDVLRAIPDFRARYSQIVGFVTDAFFLPDYREITGHYDLLVVPIPEVAGHLEATFGVDVHVMPFGADTLKWGRIGGARSIDVVSIGRFPDRYKTPFLRTFHSADATAMLLHSPIGHSHGPAIWSERAMLWKLLHRCRIALAFDLLIDPNPARPITHPVVTPRWFEAMAAGCAIVGRSPTTALAGELFDWPDALIELSEDPDVAASELLALANDVDRMEEVGKRNAIAARARHDWRYRLAELFGKLGLELPGRLEKELLDLGQLVSSTRSSAEV